MLISKTESSSGEPNVYLRFYPLYCCYKSYFATLITNLDKSIVTCTMSVG